METDVVVVTDATFENEVLRAKLPVMVDFWAPWCGPCMQFKPTYESYAARLRGRVKFCTVNVDENPATTAKYDVRSIPSLRAFEDGREVGKASGGVNAALGLLDSFVKTPSYGPFKR